MARFLFSSAGPLYGLQDLLATQFADIKINVRSTTFRNFVRTHLCFSASFVGRFPGTAWGKSHVSGLARVCLLRLFEWFGSE